MDLLEVVNIFILNIYFLIYYSSIEFVEHAF